MSGIGLEIPELPVFSEEQINKSLEQNDNRPLLFEYYKWLAIFITTVSSIYYDRNIMSDMDEKSYGVFVWLFVRIAKLMHSSVVLMEKWSHSETIIILSRCILESAYNIRWLCEEFQNDSVNRFVKQSFKSDLRLVAYIEKATLNEWRQKLPIEERLLSQVLERKQDAWIIDDQEIYEAYKKYPDWMGIIGDNPAYHSAYAFASHILHGDWIGLRWGWMLDCKNGQFVPNFDEQEIDGIYMISEMLILKEAVQAYIEFLFLDEQIVSVFGDLLDEFDGALFEHSHSHIFK